VTAPAPRLTFEEVRARVAAREARIDALEAEERPSYRFRDRNPASGPLFVSRDPAKPGRWRMTHFLADLQPRGHVEAATLREALREAASFGADLGKTVDDVISNEGKGVQT
jgi:hypothetical protein